jgi:hypothetical protein
MLPPLSTGTRSWNRNEGKQRCNLAYSFFPQEHSVHGYSVEALAARAAPVVAAILLGLVAAVLAHGERLPEVGQAARVRVPAGRLLPELDGPRRLGRVGVERVGGPRGEQREAGIGGVVVEGRRGGDDHHPDVGRAVVQLAHGGGRAFIEAEGEVVAAGKMEEAIPAYSTVLTTFFSSLPPRFKPSCR